MYNMALTFEAKNVELAKEKSFSFDVSRKDHDSNGKKQELEKVLKVFMFGRTRPHLID